MIFVNLVRWERECVTSAHWKSCTDMPRSRNSSVGIATGWTDGVRFPTWERDFLFSAMSIWALRPTHPPIQCVQAAISPGLERLGHETDRSPPSSAEAKNDGAIPPLPVHLHDLVFN
jgi:hypothetical protein